MKHTVLCGSKSRTEVIKRIFPINEEEVSMANLFPLDKTDTIKTR